MVADVSGPERLRTAVVGTGFIGPQHVDAVRRTCYADVTALVSPDLEQGRAVASALGVPRVTSELAEVLADPTIHVVHVCTPNHTHVALATAALAAGKHVVVEKPVAIDREGAAALLAAVQQSHRHAAVALTYRGYPMVRRARELVQTGRLGAARLLYGAYAQDWLADADDYNWRLEAAAGGASRAFADVGTHWFDTAEFIAGTRAESVLADMATFVPFRRRPIRATAAFAAAVGETEEVAIATEDAATVLVRFEGGARGAVVVSQVSPGNKNALTIELAGATRSLSWAQEDPERLWMRGRSDTVLLGREPSTDGRRVGAPPLPAGHPEGWGEALRDLFRPFYAAIAEGLPPPAAGAEAPYPTLADGARGIALIDAVVQSSRVGGWTPVVPIALPADATTGLGGHTQ